MRNKYKTKLALLLSLIMVFSMLFTLSSNAANLIRNSTFKNNIGLPWNVVYSYPAEATFEIKNEKYYVTITNKGTNRWDVQFRHRGLIIQLGHTYKVTFTVSANKDCFVYPKIGDQGDPFNEYWNYKQQFAKLQLTANTPVTVTDTFTMNKATANTCEFAFHIGGDCATSALPYTLVFDDISVEDAAFPGYPDDPLPPVKDIRVNQLGYFPSLEKTATLVSSATSPVGWSLKDATGKVVTSGQTKVFGSDKASGDNVHTIDFSTYTVSGKGYTLVAGTAESYPFDIATDMYSKLKYSALNYFYQNRSGIEIKLPFCLEAQWARPAGHPADIVTPDPTKWYKANYSLDVTGGWYDAGDHGKYVVNGGISAWTMMNQYEHALLGGAASLAPFADGKMNIPESTNGIPDLLDEARWEMEFMLKMQVPAGNTLAGMVHHKMHDELWTALGLRPDQDPQKRYLQPPSTAATLNLAATAAQSSRLWQKYDAAFANKCITSAETAWTAAVANPAIYATFTNEPGGGPYGDDYVLDDFYWAASELYVTTGKVKYLDYIKSSKYYLQMPTKLTGGEDKGVTGCFDWGNTSGMGTISLASVPNNLTKADVDLAKKNIQAAADTFINIGNTQGYGSPIDESPISDTLTGYPWGSNSFIVNECIVMAYAYDFSTNAKYLNGAAEAMDYILGRNPNLQSYVTGYGDNPLKNPHHRFWAYQTDPSFPKAPPGALSGGPNSGLQDPWVLGSGWKPGSYPPEKCFMDNIESWSTNEITINWNTPLAWVTAYLDEKGPQQTQVIKYGDVNGDTFVNSTDFAWVKKFLLGQITEFPDQNGLAAADVNGDGAVNSIDFAWIKKFLLGQITKFPIEP